MRSQSGKFPIATFAATRSEATSVILSSMLMLYHGTTLAAAKRILNEGWTVQPPEEHIGSIARDYGKEPAALLEFLRETNRFATTPTRGNWASFGLNRAIAVRSWAQRAPEVRWEALWAIWRLDHPEIPIEIETMSRGDQVKQVEVLPRTGEAWVFQQMHQDPLAVITLTLSYEMLIGFGAKTDGFEHKPLPPVRVLSGQGGPQPPGVAIPCPFKPPGSRLTLHPIDHIVRWRVFADVLGLSDEEFQRRDRLGEFGPHTSDGVPPSSRDEEQPWWTLSAVQHHLPAS